MVTPSTRTSEPALRLTALTVPGPFVRELLDQTGLTRDQLRWGLNLAVADRFIKPERLRLLFEHELLLCLADLLVIVGAGDLESAFEYRENLADAQAEHGPCPSCSGLFGTYNPYHPQGHCLSCQPDLAGDR